MQIRKLFPTIAVITLALVLPTLSFAGSATISWKGNTEPDLSGYKIYYGTASRSYGPPVPVGKVTQHTLANLTDGKTYYFGVTALDYSGNESGYSAEAKKTITATTSTSGTTTTTAAGSYQVALWWTATGTRYSNVPVRIYDGSTLLKTVRVNQQRNGGRWNALGTFSFKNQPKVMVVSETANYSTCADAVKFVSSTGTTLYIDNGKTGTTASGSWTVSSGVKPYGSNSLYSKTNGATYSFTPSTSGSSSTTTTTTTSTSGTTSTATAGSYQVALWWTATGTRYSNVPVRIYDGSTLLKTVRVNQQRNGGCWNALGTFSFKSQPKVVVVAETANYSTCADAVKFVSSTGTTYIDNGKSGTTASGSWAVSNGVKPYGSNSLYSRTNGGTYTFVQGS
jgi:muramidase (phage lysozyme)